jgi:hypothetical protein
MGRLITTAVFWVAHAALAAAPAGPAVRDGVALHYHEPLRSLTLQDHRAGVIMKPGPGQPVTLQFEAFGRRFELQLTPNASLLPTGTRSQLAQRDIYVYRGQLTNVPASWARLVIANGIVRGTLFDGSELYSLEAPGDTLPPGAAGPVIYRLADVVVEPGQLGCAAEPGSASGNTAYATLVAELKTLVAGAEPGATQNLNLGAVADFEFTEDFGSGTEVALLDRFNRVDGIFSAELGVQITVNQIDIFAVDDDPFTESVPGELLTQLSRYRSGNPAQRAQGLSHLFTGRDLDSTTVGIAYIGALCSSFAGAGLSEGRRGPLTDSLIAAHEIGHNFGADHDGDPGGSCPDTPTTFLMAPSINGSNQFSQCSKDQMALEVAAASCITPIADVDMAVSIDDPSLTVLTGIDFSYGITVDNGGKDTAEDVNVSLQIPAAITAQTAEPSAGTCSIGGGAVDCDLGSVTGNSSRTIALTLQAATPGDLTISVSVSASDDNNAANNLVQGAITADPAVDLAVTPVSDARIDENASGTLQVTVRNDTDLTATGVAVRFDLDGGLRAFDADYPLGSCTVNEQRVDCGGGTLGGNDSTQLTLSYTGVNAGQHGINVTASATEAELDGANNTAAATISVQNVSAASAPPGGGGGGALFWTVLLLIPTLRQRPPRPS